jgi:aldose 1-epimerase
MTHSDEIGAGSARQTDQTDIIQIGTQEAQAAVTLAGGCIVAYRLTSDDNEFDLLRPLTRGANGEISPLAASSFPLIPYSNRIKNGHFRFGGEAYQLPLNFGDHPHSIHGMGWQMPWRLKDFTEQIVEIDVSCDGSEWPFAFYANQVIRLDGKDLRHEITLTNTGRAAMPAGLGMHPYLPRHGNAILTAEVEAVWLTDETCLPTERVACPEHWKLSAGARVDALVCDNQFEPWNGLARVDWPNENMALYIKASDDLNRLIVYAPEGEDFFCVEPVSHMTDAFNRSADGMPPAASGMRVLEPGESWRVWMELSPSPL